MGGTRSLISLSEVPSRPVPPLRKYPSRGRQRAAAVALPPEAPERCGGETELPKAVKTPSAQAAEGVSAGLKTTEVTERALHGDESVGPQA